MVQKQGKIMVKVSIIVPVYNVEKYLGKCLESLTAQTLKDIEIICINDGSTDDSLTVLQNFAAKDKRIKLIDKENGGPGVARNLGIKTAKGEYIGFVDPDDWVREDMYENMYAQAKRLDSDIVICDYVRYEDWSGEIVPHCFFQRAVKYNTSEPVDVPSGENIDRETLLETLLISPCYSVNRIYRRAFLQQNKIVYSEHYCYEDCPFVLQSHLAAQRVSFADYAGYIYRLRQDSLVRGYAKKYMDFCEVVKLLEQIIAERNLSEKMALNLHYFRTMNMAWSYMQTTPEEKKSLLRQARKFLTAKEYVAMKKYLQIRLRDKLKKILGVFVSVKKKPRHKVVKVLGLSFKLKRRCGRLGAEQHYIRQVRENCKKYPKDTYLLFDCLHDENVEAIDAYCLFEEMRAQGIPAYYVVRKQTALYRRLEVENKLENIIALTFSSRTHPNEFMQKIKDVLLRTKCILTSFGENSGSVEMFFRRCPAWKYIFIQHGTIFMKESVLYNGYLFPKKFDKFLVCSDREESIWKKYGFTEDKLLKVGLPRWDLLKNLPQPQEKSILLMLTWRQLNAVSFDDSLYKKRLLSLLHNKKLQKYLKQHDINLYFAPHHALAGNSHINFDLSKEGNIQIIEGGKVSHYIRQCSAMMTDFSSVAFDFMFQHKPVVFYMLDRDDVALGEYDREDLQKFDYKQYILPDVFFDEEKAVERLIEYCENNFEIDENTQKIYDSFFYTKENIRRQLIEKLEQL
ncbi:MAG: glycosyltransferase [Alphaproteobacteria bacterium]|nr:glycosyltransferase [Alphaproteobacteria bacterium]